VKKVLGVGGILLVLGAAGVIAFFGWREQQLTRFAQEPFGTAEAHVVDIPPGTGPKLLGTLLERYGVVSSAESFYAYVRREKLAPKLKAGEYEFVGPLTPAQVVEKIVSGQVKQYHFTVPEGLRMEEILPILAASELKLNLEKLQRLSADKSFARKLGVPTPALNLEGFLYPDTYSFTRGANEEAVLSRMVARTLDEYRKADAQRKAGVSLDLLQTVTLGSIVEKETGAPEERPRISCVFHNRLRLGMKLQTDPTVLYAMKLIRGSFIKNITSQDLTTPHPYNTYTTAGLPPGPIASPGAAALQAALNPIDCNDLFFVSRNNGTHVFCPDLKCHNGQVEKWQRAYFRKPKRSKH